MQIHILPERPDSPDALALITELDANLTPLYPQESRHGYSVAQLLTQEVAFFVVRAGESAVGCCGIQLFGTEYAEVKRMYVRPAWRGLGYAKQMLQHLEEYARARGIPLLRLETGIYQEAATGLYERMGFYRIPPFGSYRDDPLSLYYEKQLLDGD
jgi:GNAT superfamily N-acetyltransferase